MRRTIISLSACVVLFASGLVTPPSIAGGERHPLIRRAVVSLQAARDELRGAAHDYCGHRVGALEATNVALNQLRKALSCARRYDSGGEDLETEPVMYRTAGAEPHPRIYAAIDALGAAQGDLQNAAHDYCGHRVEALEAVRAALTQLRLAIECDRR
ncbi:MAG TPA: hypothetical protein VEZ90_03665 [Blastocatellia bacterium]|nr:hypothetical protein [Blastocatellia bacterium]